MDENQSTVDQATQWLVRFVGKLSPKVALQIMTLIELLRAKETPNWVKGVVVGALAYVVLPFDVIPDFIPLAGLTDDIGAVAAALVTVAQFISPELKARAEERLKGMLGK